MNEYDFDTDLPEEGLRPSACDWVIAIMAVAICSAAFFLSIWAGLELHQILFHYDLH